jgi:MFS family permease
MKILLFLISQHAGDWFVRIAALVSVRRLTQGSSTALSILVMCKTLPEVLFTPFGGMIADRFDRKKAMMRLDIIAGFVVMSYILAVRSENVHYLYLATIARSIIQAFYDPTTKSITPMIVIDAQDLKRAATLSGMIWSGKK